MYRYNLGICFEETVENNSNRAALRINNDYKRYITYEELNATANQLAKYLLNLGICPGDVVCISGNKEFITFASMIACLKIGAAYAILDSDSPAERLKKIINTCSPKILLADSISGEKYDNVAKMLDTKIIIDSIENLEDKIHGYNSCNLSETAGITGVNPAYIMFTSGSTGFPKGALMTHDNVINLIHWSIDTYHITPDEILTNVNPLFFDNSVFDFYTALFSGASLVPFSKEIVTNARDLIEGIEHFKCTSWFSVPSLLIFLHTMKVFKQDNLKSIKRFIFGGEGYPKPKLKKLFDLYSDRVEFYNVYGPTECTCICSSYKISDQDFEDMQGFPPLGEINPNFSYLILDDNNQTAADNQVGELCLLGPNVGKGYYNDPERTKTSFIQNPTHSNFTEILYKTGDLIKFNSEDDKIHIMGRKDNQIKHMGYRIELEEIETALSCLDYISQAAVLHGNSRGLSQIIAVVATRDSTNENTVRKDLRKIIPDYMIPNEFYFQNELPKNPNGKVNRQKLAKKYFIAEWEN